VVDTKDTGAAQLVSLDLEARHQRVAVVFEAGPE
jgi:hypothetical protein